jgi:hypothetical protein
MWITLGIAIVIDNTHAEAREALTPVAHEGEQMIDARALHGWLAVGE